MIAPADPARAGQALVARATDLMIARNLVAARQTLVEAIALGNPDALHMLVALTANGSGAPPDWAHARTLLENAADRDEAAAAECALLGQMALTDDGAPVDVPRPRQIGDAPNVRHVAQLFSMEECRHVAQSAADLLAPATVVDPRTGRNVANPVRTSDGAVIGPTRESLVIRALNRRIAAVTDTDVQQGEALAVLRYRPGQQFRPHVDAIEGVANQRVTTVLVYLNQGFTGGATLFTASGLRVAPRGGDAIVFNNVRADGSIDPAAQHAGEPVVQGVKWLATRWIRARPFDVWTGPEAA